MNTMTFLKSTTFATALVASLSAGAAMAEMNNMSDQRTGTSASVQAESNSQFSNYDRNSDNRFDNSEFATYTYYTIDYDNDNMINQDEWDKYTSIWYEPVDVEYDTSSSFDDYDVDNDGYIDTSEFKDAYDYDLYASWDADNDGYIETTEYDQAVNTYHDYDSNEVYVW